MLSVKYISIKIWLSNSLYNKIYCGVNNMLQISVCQQHKEWDDLNEIIDFYMWNYMWNVMILIHVRMW